MKDKMMTRKFEPTAEEMFDGCVGFCRECGWKKPHGCDPDSDGLTCESCGSNSVAGLEVLLSEDLLEEVDCY